MPVTVQCLPKLHARGFITLRLGLTALSLLLAQLVGVLGGGGPDGMEVDGAKRTLHVGTHALSHRRDGMEVGHRVAAPGAGQARSGKLAGEQTGLADGARLARAGCSQCRGAGV